MHVRKEHAGSASSGYVWETDGDVVEVPDHIGGDLLLHDPGEFTDVTEDVLAGRHKKPDTTTTVVAADSTTKKTPTTK